MKMLQSLVGLKNNARLSTGQQPGETAQAGAETVPESALAFAPLQMARTRRDIETTLGQLEQLLESIDQDSGLHTIGCRLLDSSRALSAQLEQGFDELQAAQALTQVTITEKSVIVEFIRDRLATRNHYGNPFSLVLFHLDEVEDCHRALNILNRLVRVTDRAYLMDGNEIVVILPETSLEGGRVFAQRCVMQIIEDIGTRAFAGVADAIDDDDVTAIITRADEALYQARCDDFSFAYSHDGQVIAACESPVGEELE
jgi:GGDEF domain-containing protein